MDVPMVCSSLLFLVPGYVHYAHREYFEFIMYASVTLSSSLSDGIFDKGKYAKATTILDRIVATCALLAATRKGWLLRPQLRYKLYMLTGISFAGIFLIRGQNDRRRGRHAEYRRNHMLWHLGLTLTGLGSSLFRPPRLI